MIFERYSGSDSTGDVPRSYARFLHRIEGLGLEERVSFFDGLLAAEKDRNWRGYWTYSRAVQYLELNQTDDLIRGLRDALSEFDLLAANFRDVENEYVRTLWLLIREEYLESEDTETLFEYALRLMPHIEAACPDREDRWDLYSYVGDALLMIAKKNGGAILYRASIDYHAAAHHAAPDEPGALESLVAAYYGAGDVARARAVYEMFKELDVPYEHSERLHRFAAEAFK